MDAGIIRLIESPHGDGVVCAIGDFWFYFGGLAAEGSTPEEYRQNTPKDTIIREIYDVLWDFSATGDEFLDEYGYYSLYLQEHGI